MMRTIVPMKGFHFLFQFVFSSSFTVQFDPVQFLSYDFRRWKFALYSFPVPCSLFPVPCSLFPVPCSLFRVHCSEFSPWFFQAKWLWIRTCSDSFNVDCENSKSRRSRWARKAGTCRTFLFPWWTGSVGNSRSPTPTRAPLTYSLASHRCRNTSWEPSGGSPASTTTSSHWEPTRTHSASTEPRILWCISAKAPWTTIFFLKHNLTSTLTIQKYFYSYFTHARTSLHCPPARCLWT